MNYFRSLYPDVAKVEDAVASPATGFPLRYIKASKVEAVVAYIMRLKAIWYLLVIL